VTLLVDAEQLTEWPARHVRAAPRSGCRRRARQATATTAGPTLATRVAPRTAPWPREIAGWPVTGARKLTRRTRTPRSQPCA